MNAPESITTEGSTTTSVTPSMFERLPEPTVSFEPTMFKVFKSSAPSRAPGINLKPEAFLTDNFLRPEPSKAPLSILCID